MSLLGEFLKDFDFDVNRASTTFDLTTEEGLNGFCEQIDNMSDTQKKLLNIFKDVIGLDEDEDAAEGFKKVAKLVYDKANPKEVKEEKKIVDHTEGVHFDRPSDKLTVDQKLQLHKLTQEYVDTMIKPFSKGVLNDNQINDAYAGLYEFAAWILKK